MTQTALGSHESHNVKGCGWNVLVVNGEIFKVGGLNGAIGEG